MKKILIFGGTGQVGTHLIRKLTKNNYRVTVVTRNIHEKGHKIKIMGNAGFIDLVEANIFDEQKNDSCGETLPDSSGSPSTP